MYENKQNERKTSHWRLLKRETRPILSECQDWATEKYNMLLDSYTIISPLHYLPLHYSSPKLLCNCHIDIFVPSWKYNFKWFKWFNRLKKKFPL